MANIDQYLANIMSAVYGEDVRGSIHDAIEIINDVSEVVLTTGTAVTSTSSSSTGFFTNSLYLNLNTYELWKCVGVDTWQSLGILRGDNGDDGRGIYAIDKISTSGLVDTYQITYTDDSAPTTYEVTNGANGAPGEDGNKWYRGTGISGKAVNPTVYSDSGVTSANPNDFYLNPTEGAVYHCVVGGAASVATWSYDFTMDGGGGGGTTDYNDLTNKPSLGGTTLSGSVTLSDVGAVAAADLATVATTGSYSDLLNKPTIPAAQVNSDWNAASGVAQILNKPTIPAAQIQSDWNQTNTSAKDYIKNKPSITTVNDATLTIQRNGTTVQTFTANASSNATANIAADSWSSSATVSSSNTVTFTGLDDSLGYWLACDDKLISVTGLSITGSGSNTTFVYTVSGASQGDTCYLRILV